MFGAMGLWVAVLGDFILASTSLSQALIVAQTQIEIEILLLTAPDPSGGAKRQHRIRDWHALRQCTIAHQCGQ
nr:hypothetical protein CFP56_28459 [Quercus suber]